MQVLLVDDHGELLDLLTRALLADGHVVRSVRTVAAARNAVEAQAPELMVLDVGLPDGDGIALCGELRGSGATFPVLLLTAHGEVPRRVAGLDAGADDFLAKPFAMAELRARIRALARRRERGRPKRMSFGAMELDFLAQRAFRAGVEVPLTTREWAIVELLASRSGNVVARAEILEAVWGEDTDAASASLDVLMTRIRRKLGAESLQTRRGRGYMMPESDK